MLKISLHYATPSGANAENVLGRLDIGYAKLDAKADYKVLMFSSGEGDHPPAQVNDYPRWSASVLDLVSRAVCQSIHAAEVIPKTDPMRFGKCAFIDDLTAIIEHWPDGLDVRRSMIGTAHIYMNRRRGWMPLGRQSRHWRCGSCLMTCAITSGPITAWSSKT